VQIKDIRLSRKVVESSSKGAKLGTKPSNTGSGFVVYRRLQGHGSTVVEDSLATQKMTNCPQTKGLLKPCDSAAELRHH
jgi:hypothetical protein